MPIYITFTLDGVGTVKRRINGVINKVKDLTPAFEKIGKDFRETERRVFMGQGAYGSRPSWKSLTPKYREWKEQHFPGRPILVQTGALRQSLISRGGNNVEIITKRSITMGTKDPKFKWHQKGTNKPMVARPPITFTKYQGDKWAKIIRDEILKGAQI